MDADTAIGLGIQLVSVATAIVALALVFRQRAEKRRDDELRAREKAEREERRVDGHILDSWDDLTNRLFAGLATAQEDAATARDRAADAEARATACEARCDECQAELAIIREQAAAAASAASDSEKRLSYVLAYLEDQARFDPDEALHPMYGRRKFDRPLRTDGGGPAPAP